MDSIKLLTFNVWGLKYVSKLRRQRIQGIVTKLLDPSEDYDVVALQEVWCEEDWILIEKSLKHLYPHTRYFKAGIIAGPGLAILSKVPIKLLFLYRFPINGRPAAVNRGDWFVGKSVAVTTLMNNMVILNSHMHAPYALTGDNAYLCHRSCQAWDISRIIKLLNKAGYQIILVGDLNCRPGTLPHKLVTIESGLKDSWNELKIANNEAILNAQELSRLTPKDQILLGGVTCDSQLNTWRASRRLDEACRLDYALINQSLSVLDANVKFIDGLPGHECSYSDHFAYYAHLKINKSIDVVPASENTLSYQIYSELLAEIAEYKATVLPRHHIWRFTHFIVAIITSIFIIIANFIFSVPYALLVMFLVLGPGVLNGVILLNYLYETRNLQEVEMEVNDAMGGVPK